MPRSYVHLSSAHRAAALAAALVLPLAAAPPASAQGIAPQQLAMHSGPWVNRPGPAAPAKGPQQVVKPPVAQLWMDVATSSMPGMPDMPAVPSLGGLFGGPGGGAAQGNNAFGRTRGMSPGRFVDIAFVTQRKPGGTEATQTVPAGTGLAPSLPLLPFKEEARQPGASPGTPREVEEYEQPKGRILFYWGCGETVRPGQPRVLDFAKAAPQDWGNFVQGRATRERGAVARPGHSLWPNERDRRNLAGTASLAGEHALSGEGVPADLRFTLSAAQDFMTPIQLQQAGAVSDALRLSWQAVPNARAYFLNAMGGSDEGGVSETVFWSSAEVPDFGMGLLDYASPANVDQWLREKVLLAPAVTQCAIPKGIFAKGDGAMLRMIAYGPELNLAHPPRPADVKVAWEPQWAVRVRTKSTAMAMLGKDMDAGRSSAAAVGAAPAQAAGAAPARPDCPPPQQQAAGSDAARTGADVGGAILGGGWGRSIGSAVGGALGALGGAKKQEPANVPADCPR
jgi:hypothetical protein